MECLWIMECVDCGMAKGCAPLGSAQDEAHLLQYFAREHFRCIASPATWFAATACPGGGVGGCHIEDHFHSLASAVAPPPAGAEDIVFEEDPIRLAGQPAGWPVGWRSSHDRSTVVQAQGLPLWTPTESSESHRITIGEPSQIPLKALSRPSESCVF